MTTYVTEAPVDRRQIALDVAAVYHRAGRETMHTNDLIAELQRSTRYASVNPRHLQRWLAEAVGPAVPVRSASRDGSWHGQARGRHAMNVYNYAREALNAAVRTDMLPQDLVRAIKRGIR